MTSSSDRKNRRSLFAAAAVLAAVVVSCGCVGEGATPRITSRDGRFIELSTGRPFQPRGFNYIRLRDGWHATFAPEMYDAERAEAMLVRLAAGGFNVVRVFIDHTAPHGIAAADGAEGFSDAYLANVLDFLRRARRHRVYVVLTPVWLPPLRLYQQLGAVRTPNVEGANQLYFSAGHIAAKARYLADLAAAVREAALNEAVFAYDLTNEAAMDASLPPLSLKSGLCTPANGQTYDLSDGRQVQQMADDHAVLWADTCAAAIRRVDGRAMVSAGVFTFRAVGRSGPGRLHLDDTPDARVPLRPLALARSNLSYIDVHLYPVGGLRLEEDLRSIEWSDLRLACRQAGKPLVMGEFGVFRKDYPTIAQASQAVAGHLRGVMEQGFCGFMYWTYDTDEQERLWNACSGDGEIFRALTGVVSKPAAGPAKKH